MNKEELIHTLAAHAYDAVVLLEKSGPTTHFRQTLRSCRCSDYFITNRGA